MTGTQEEGTGQLGRLSERSSAEDESMWEMVDADQSPEEEPPLELEVRPISEISTSDRGERAFQQTVGGGTDTGEGESYNDNDEWEEIHPDQFSGAAQVWNHMWVGSFR